MRLRLLSGIGLRLLELVRRPAILALLLVLPPLAIEVYGIALESFPQLPGLADTTATIGRVTGALFAVAFLGGLVGLFEVIGARQGDERLALCGYPRSLLLATRLTALAVVGAIASGIALLVLGRSTEVAAPVTAMAVLAATAALYGALGVVVGSILPRDLEGSLVLVFLADLDNVLSSRLFEVGAIAEYAPLYHPHAVFRQAVVDGRLADGHVLPILAYLAAVVVLAVVAYTRSIGP